MNTGVALMCVLDVEIVLHRRGLVQGCQHQRLSVPPHSLPTRRQIMHDKTIVKQHTIIIIIIIIITISMKSWQPGKLPG